MHMHLHVYLHAHVHVIRCGDQQTPYIKYVDHGSLWFSPAREVSPGFWRPCRLKLTKTFGVLQCRLGVHVLGSCGPRTEYKTLRVTKTHPKLHFRTEDTDQKIQKQKKRKSPNFVF